MGITPGERLKNRQGAACIPQFDHDDDLSRIEQDLEKLENRQRNCGARQVADLGEVRERLAVLTERAYNSLSGSQTVQLARHAGRPRFSDYLNLIVKDFCELHGDRNVGDDRDLVTGFGRIAGYRLLLVGHNKGCDVADRVSRCSGYAHAEGYRKALRKMKLAEKFGVPIVTWIDTPGAFPGVEAEERGIAHAIAENLKEMSRLRVPIVCIVLGEGGSGGALGIGVGDRLAMLKHAYYSVITPEGCAAILFRNTEQAPRAADALQLRATDLKRLGLIDDIVDEPLGGAHRDPVQAAASLKSYIAEALGTLQAVSIDVLLERRQARLRGLGTSS